MKRKRHQEEQIIRILREAERGEKAIVEVFREHARQSGLPCVRERNEAGFKPLMVTEMLTLFD